MIVRVFAMFMFTVMTLMYSSVGRSKDFAMFMIWSVFLMRGIMYGIKI